MRHMVQAPSPLLQLALKAVHRNCHLEAVRLVVTARMAHLHLQSVDNNEVK